MKPFSFEIPVRVVSEANRREHWAARFRRQAEQKQFTVAAMLNAERGRHYPVPCVVKLTRVGAKKLDDDNLSNGFKAIRDAISYRLGFDDGDTENIRFEYAQIATGKRDYSVKVEIKSTERD